MDIYCALCGEPWGTRGLHYSHSDLDLHDWFNLVNGYGCPCCRDNGKRRGDPPDESLLDQWRRSVARASEGTIETFELIPAQCEVVHNLVSGGINRVAAAALVAEEKYTLVPWTMLGGD